MRYRPSLAVKMMLAIALVSAMTTYATYLAHSRLTAAAIYDIEVERATSLRVEIEAEVREKIKRITVAARLLRQHPELLAAAADDAPPATRRARLRPLLDRFYPLIDVDILEVTDRDERVLYRAHAPDAFGDVQSIWGVAEALTGQEAEVTAAGRSGLAIRKIVPLGEGNNPPAVLSVGIHIGDSMARRIAADVQAEIAILSPQGDVLAASMPEAAAAQGVDRELVARSLQGKHTAHPLWVRGDKTAVYFAESIVDQTYVWFVAVDSRHANAEAAEAEQQALRIALLCGLLSTAVLGLLAHRHARRLHALQRETEETVQRLFGHANSSSSSSSEIESLATSTRLMTARLVAHAEEMRLAREVAESASTAKSQFLAVMSHEIRTPLNGVLGMLSLLLDSELGAHAHHFAQTAYASGRALLAIINDILDLSRIEAGRLDLERVGFDLGEHLAEVCDLLRGSAERKGLHLVGEIAPEVPRYVLGDPVRLRQVLVNLVGNAIKFTARGSVNIAVATVEHAGSACLLRFSITDTGIGIAPALQTRLFEAFAQADHSTTRRYGGSGLGLAIAKYLTELMGGLIGYESEPGRGATFWFTARFPVAQNPALSAAAPPLPVHDHNTGRFHARVLVAEDDLINLEIALAMLENLGCQVASAENGAQALDRAAAGFDLILMDVHMPEMDGLEASRRIRQMESEQQHGRVPIIAITASAMQKDRDNCMACGMDDFLSKPFTPEELHTVLQRYLPLHAQIPGILR